MLPLNLVDTLGNIEFFKVRPNIFFLTSLFFAMVQIRLACAKSISFLHSLG